MTLIKSGGLLWAVVAGAVICGYTYSIYRAGEISGQDSILQKWDEEKRKVDKKIADARDRSNDQAADLRDKLAKLKATNAAVEAQRDSALKRKFTCPVSGEVGDIELPAAYIDSMFNRQNSDGISGAAER